MALSGSASYYMQQRGITQSGLHGSPGIHQFTSPNVQYQSSISSTTMAATLPVEPLSGISPHSVNVGTPQAVPPSGSVKRKRGRPRKYGLDGTVSLALTCPASATHPGTITPSQKRGRGRPPGTGKKQQLSSLGHCNQINVIFSARAKRSMHFVSQWFCLYRNSSTAIIIGWHHYIRGSYLLTSNIDSHNRTGGLSISLASSDGRVIGGGIGGMLIAASPVQVIVGSFISGGSKIKNKKGGEEGHIVDNLVAPPGISPSQNLTQTSPAGMWPVLRSIDIRNNNHVDIDLMRG